MLDIRELERKISKARTAGNPNSQLSVIMSLLNQIKGYVEEIQEEKELVDGLREAERELDKLKSSKDEDDSEKASKIAELNLLIGNGKSAQSMMAQNRAALRSVLNAVESIRTEIKKVVS